MKRSTDWMALEAEALAERVDLHRAEHAAIMVTSRALVHASRVLIKRALRSDAISREPSLPRSAGEMDAK